MIQDLPAGQTNPSVGGVASGLGMRGGVFRSTVSEKRPEAEGRSGGRACHGNACRDFHFRLHGNLKEKAPLKSSTEAWHGVLRTGPQRFSCPRKDLPGPVFDLEFRVQQPSGSPWKGSPFQEEFECRLWVPTSRNLFPIYSL